MKALPHVSTGSTGLDRLLGKECPGFPRGHMSEVYGHSGSGKTSLMISAACAVTKNLGVTYYFDALGQLSGNSPGVDDAAFDSRFYLMNTGNILELRQSILEAIGIGVDLVVVDGIAALSGPARPEGEATFERETTALQKAIWPYLENSNTALVFANHSLGDGHGTGGKGFRFAMSLKVQLTHDPLDDVTTEEPVIRAKITKNIFSASQGKTTKFTIRDGRVKGRAKAKPRVPPAPSRFDREDPI